MKKILIPLLLLFSFSAQASYAKGSFLKKLERGVNIASNVITTVKALDEIANDTKQEKTRVVYRDRIIYKERERPSDESLEIKKELATTQRKLAWEKAKDKKHETALKLYQQSLENDANSWYVWHGYGWSFSELKRYDEARNAFLMAISLGAKDESWRYLGWNYARQGYHKEAVRCYAEAMKINPDNDQAFHGLTASKKALKGGSNDLGHSASNSNAKSYQVVAKPHLFLRSKPSKKGREIGKILNNSYVKLIEYTGKKQTIGRNRARWALVEYKGKKGYVFSAYLKRN